MTSFVHIDQPTDHPGVNRAVAALEGLRAARHRLDGSRGLAALMLAAMVSALLVVADRLISTWADGGLLLAWVALWAVAFVALALFSGSTRAFAARTASAWRANARRRAVRRQDLALWNVAQTDSRVMADIACAVSRASDVQGQSASKLRSKPEAARRDRIAMYF